MDRKLFRIAEEVSTLSSAFVRFHKPRLGQVTKRTSLKRGIEWHHPTGQLSHLVLPVRVDEKGLGESGDESSILALPLTASKFLNLFNSNNN